VRRRTGEEEEEEADTELKAKKTHVNVGNKNPTRQCGKKSTVRALRAFQVNIM